LPAVYVIINGKIDPDPECVDDRVIPLAFRALDVNQSALKEFNLFEVWVITQYPRPTFSFNWISIPQALQPPPPNGIFDPKTMSFEFDAGKRLMQAGGDPWEHDFPWKTPAADAVRSTTRASNVGP
jgi:hypothetical protein